MHITVDDKEEAAAYLGTQFPNICRFIDSARLQPGGCVFVHCGAGISRAPTAVASYLMWKLDVPAIMALKIIQSARPCIRPNVGFAAQLRDWETKKAKLGHSWETHSPEIDNEGLKSKLVSCGKAERALTDKLGSRDSRVASTSRPKRGSQRRSA